MLQSKPFQTSTLRAVADHVQVCSNTHCPSASKACNRLADSFLGDESPGVNNFGIAVQGSWSEDTLIHGHRQDGSSTCTDPKTTELLFQV